MIVLINKSRETLKAKLEIKNQLLAYSHAKVYQLTDKSDQPVQASDISFSKDGVKEYLMPALSISTLVLD